MEIIPFEGEEDLEPYFELIREKILEEEENLKKKEREKLNQDSKSDELEKEVNYDKRK